VPLAEVSQMPNISEKKIQKTIHKNPGEKNLNMNKLISEDSFRNLISVERKRTERSGKPFMVMLLDISMFLNKSHLYIGNKTISAPTFDKIINAIIKVTRDIDIKGWHQTGKKLGILFTEISADCKHKIVDKIIKSINSNLKPDQASKIKISCYWYPFDLSELDVFTTEMFYPDPASQKKIFVIAKRIIDIIGSVFGLVLFSPVFIFASILIKLTSSGPVFFRQERVGKGGKIFRIFKFRTMMTKNDQAQHIEFMKQFIKGKTEGITDNLTGEKVFKITNDSRITMIGKFLRRSSLDEIPQFINVLLGDMSLVGPRPPIAYEVKEYDLWHCRRVLDCKPGITGYWQVVGRSQTNFDGMVRMDITYISKQSFLFDLKMIFKTPGALLNSKGAY
jgi:lipopolysaccharide/colanic/teichoic acid biosynthesis glycosyltransferase